MGLPMATTRREVSSLKLVPLKLACVLGVSAVLFTGCSGNNYGVKTKNANRGYVIHQSSAYRSDATGLTRMGVGTNGGMSRTFGAAGTTGSRTSGSYSITSRHADPTRGTAGTSSLNSNSHILQLGNWMRIVGSSDGAGANGKSRLQGNRTARASGAGTTAGSRRGIESFNEHSADQVVLLTVTDPKAIKAIDRVNLALSSRSGLRAKSDTLVKDLAYILQKASETRNASGMSRGTSVSGRR